MAKDLRLDVVIGSDAKGAVTAAAALDDIANKADKAGNQMKETGLDADFLAIQLELAKVKARELADAFNKTGDRSFLKQSQAASRYAKQLENVGKTLLNDGEQIAKDAEKVGQQAGQSAANGIIGAFQALPPEVQAAIVAGVAVSLPVLGVMIGGAVIAGIGTAGIGAGIAVALKNPAVHSALDGLKTEISTTLTAAAAPFVGPTIAAFHELGQTFTNDIGPQISRAFKALAPAVGPLERGLGQFVTSLATGFERVAVVAGPILTMLGNELLPQLGKSIQALFTTIAHNSGAASQGLKLLFAAIEVTIGIINVSINVLSAVFEGLLGILADVADGFRGFLDMADNGVQSMGALGKVLLGPIVGGLHSLRHEVDGSVTTFDNFVTGVDQSKDATNGAAGALNHQYVPAVSAADAAVQAFKDQIDLLNGALSNDQAMNSALDAIDAFTKGVQKNGGSLDQNTAAGRKNRELYDSAIQTFSQLYAQLSKDDPVNAQKKFQGLVDKLDAAARKAGFTEGQIKLLNQQLDLIPKSKTINITAVYSQQQLTSGNLPIIHRATGGPFAAGQTMLVGERGPELVRFGAGGTVTPNHALGGGSTTVAFETNGDQLVSAILAALRPVIRGQYRGNVTAALGGTR